MHCLLCHRRANGFCAMHKERLSGRMARTVRPNPERQRLSGNAALKLLRDKAGAPVDLELSMILSSIKPRIFSVVWWSPEEIENMDPMDTEEHHTMLTIHRPAPPYEHAAFEQGVALLSAWAEQRNHLLLREKNDDLNVIFGTSEE